MGKVAITATLLFLCGFAFTHAGQFLEAEKVFVRSKGAPVTEKISFSTSNPGQPFFLKIQNGPDGKGRISSATVKLNGVEIFAPRDFNQNVQWLEKPVSLKQNNILEVRLASSPGSAIKVQVYGVDDVVPFLAIDSPTEGEILRTDRPSFLLRYSDVHSGLNLSSLKIMLNGENRTGNFTAGPNEATWSVSEDQALDAGSYTLTAMISDRAGNTSQVQVNFTVVLEPEVTLPLVIITHPAPGALYNFSPILVNYTVDGEAQSSLYALTEGPNQVIISSTNASGTGKDTVDVILDTQPPVVQITRPGRDTTVTASPFTVHYTVDGQPRTRTIDLVEGPNSVSIDSTDAAGNTGVDFVDIALDTKGPVVSIASPAQGSTLADLLVYVKVAFSDTGSRVDLTTLDISLDGTSILSSLSQTPDSVYGTLSLSEGSHILSAKLSDLVGNPSQVQSEFILALPEPTLTITAPANFTTVSDADILVEGDLTVPLTDLRVDGIAATITGNSFRALVPLADGRNTLLASGFDANGKQASASVTVTLDREKPRIYIHAPADGLKVREDQITVAGAVTDRIADAQGQSMPTVTVNGVVAQVANNTFSAQVPLSVGPNTITAVAKDKAGNVASAVIHVNRDDAPQPAVHLVSGQAQSAFIFTPLANPLVAAVKDGSGQAVPGKPVIFRVSQGDGTLTGGARTLLVTSNAQGEASTIFTLGKRSGPGANQVIATAPNFAGEAVFHALAQPQSAAKINTALGDMQRGLVGAPASQPLVAIVTDSGNNPLEGVAVEFKVEEGGGHFHGQNKTTAMTGADGRAFAAFTLGQRPGRDNNLVAANYEGNTGHPAMFVLSGYEAGPAAETKVSGVILNNSNQPIPGVTVRIDGSGQQTTTDEAGQFILAGAPVGVVHLRIDGSTATTPGDWVTLHFELNAISGVNNDVGMPIYLVAKNNAEGKVASATEDQILTLSDIPGFSMKVPAGSATFPADMDDHTLTITSVATDKIPMPPGEGMQPRFIISIGPAEAKFDPPAPITYPNVDGLKPGEQTHFYSFDHDLGTFVSIGTGTVSEDASVITSDPGFGIVKGGWHCAGPNNPTGQAEPPAVEIIKGDGENICIGEIITLNAEGKPSPGEMDWNGGEIPASKTESSAISSFSTKFSSEGTKTVTAKWTCKSGQPSEPAEATINVFSKEVPQGPDKLDFPAPTGIETEPLGLVTVDITAPEYEAYVDCSSKKWKLKIIKPEKADVGLGINLGNREEITDALIGSTKSCGELDKMYNSLKAGFESVKPITQGYYMESAVLAHENIHISNYKSGYGSAFQELIRKIDAIGEPISTYNNKNNARVGLMFSSKTIAAGNAFTKKIIDVKAAEEGHDNPEQYLNAVKIVVLPVMAKIAEAQKKLGCP